MCGSVCVCVGGGSVCGSVCAYASASVCVCVCARACVFYLIVAACSITLCNTTC